jgi:hypothetical protein
MSKVMEHWDNLLRQAIAKDDDERENAIFQIGLILERHYQPNQDAPDLYETNLSRELLRLVLDESRQQDTLLYLITLVKNQSQDAASLIYAIRRANPALFIQPLLKLLGDYGQALTNDAAYEVVLALEACIKAQDDNVVAALRAAELAPLLTVWADGSDTLLGGKTKRMMVRLKQVITPAGSE